jgi:hypothetical protein
MAGQGRRTFAAGEVLTASNVMGYLQDQAVMKFAGTAARGSAIGTAVSEGMVSYLADTNVVQAYDGSAWNSLAYVNSGSVLNTLQTIVTSQPTVTATGGWLDISGFSVTITPKSSSSKIFVTMTAHVGNSVASFNHFRILRDATAVGVGTVGSTPMSASTYIEDSGRIQSVASSVLDSPATASAVTYKVQWQANTGISYLNRRGSSTDFNPVSTITVMEIAG